MTDLSSIPRDGTPVIPATGRTPALSRNPALPEHDAQRLTGPSGLAHIRLGEALYTLRITRQGKLILTK